MRNNHLDSENFEQQNTSYQTGSFDQRPAGKSSGLIALLLVLVIFLGGLASALGLLNIRLLTQLMQQADPTVQVGLSTPASDALSDEPLASADEPVPSAPQASGTRLQLHTDAAGGYADDVHTIAQATADSRVTVQAYSYGNVTEAFGLVISADGFVLTNNHILDSASHIYVTLSDGQRLRACLVGNDILTDMAVLYIQAEGLTPAVFGSAEQLQTGDTIALASPQLTRRESLLHPCSVSSTKKSVSLVYHNLDLLETSMGSSDGPVYDQNGHVVAMSSSRVCDYFDLYVQVDTGFAVPSDTIASVVNQILEQGYVSGRPTLGIRTEVISKMYQTYWNLPGGLRVVEVSEAAQAQGLKEGDILLAFNGMRLESQADLAQVLLSNEIGLPLTAVILRDGNHLTLSIRILEAGE